MKNWTQFIHSLLIAENSFLARVSLLAIAFALAQPVNAYVPSAKMIVDKLVERNGKPLTSLEQEVTLHVGAETFSFREIWLIDSDKNLKVTVNGLGILKDNFKLQFLYSGNQKWVQEFGKERSPFALPKDFFERFLYVHSGEELAYLLAENGMAPAGFYTKKNYTVNKNDFIYDPEPYVRLARISGGVSYLFATTPSQIEKKPGLWVEQDRFVIKKIRLPSGAEMLADEFQIYDSNFNVGKTKTIQWSGYKAQIKVASVNKRDNKALVGLQPSSLEASSPLEVLKTIRGSEAIIEFYSRFR